VKYVLEKVWGGWISQHLSTELSYATKLKVH
jgi:hypothetical protein